MRGQFFNVWSETWREIWKPLSEHSEFGDDLVPDLYRELVDPPVAPEMPTPEHPLDDDGELTHPDDIAARDTNRENYVALQERQALYEETAAGRGNVGATFRETTKELMATELAAVDALERAHIIVSSYGYDAYTNRYFNKVSDFLHKYSLRYDLRRPFSLHPTLPGLFAQLLTELRGTTNSDALLSTLMNEFEEALRDLKADSGTRNIKTCIQKQVNLLEAMGQIFPGVTANTLGQICTQVGTWPHARLMDAMKDVYRFTCDYPGIRHGGNPAHSVREIEMRDLVAVCVMMASFAPYLSDQIDSDRVYRGG